MTKKGLDFMLEYIQDYLNGDTERMFFDLDFNYYLIENYPAMERKNPETAECFVYYLSEQGTDCTDGLSDAAHKSLIKKQLMAFKDALKDGFL